MERACPRHHGAVNRFAAGAGIETFPSSDKWGAVVGDLTFETWINEEIGRSLIGGEKDKCANAPNESLHETFLPALEKQLMSKQIDVELAWRV